MARMKEIFLMFIPRFVTDRVALQIDHVGNYSVYCLESKQKPEDKMFIACYGTIKTFTWLGFTKGGNVVLEDE